jgi:hypothetical protein
MFDDVICLYPLGDDTLPKKGWQTKDMDCLLEHYTIHEDGRLTKPWVDPNGDPDDPPSVVKDEHQDYTGEICFYTYTDTKYDNRVTFRARFDHGRLVELTKLAPEHAVIHVDTSSAAQQRMAMQDSMEHLLKKDRMAIKWQIWGDINAGKEEDRAVYIEAREGPEGRKYAVIRDGSVLGKKGEWEYEPMPSSRTDKFIARTRYKSFDEAFNQFKKATGKDAL